MSDHVRSLSSRLSATLKSAFLGPQLLAFLPALTLGGYWYGGEGVLLFLAVFLPAFLALVGLFVPARARRAGARRAADRVTGLALPGALTASLDRAFAIEEGAGLRTACLALEIDDFHRVGDAHGPAASDSVLKQVGQRLAGCLRDSDILARLDASVFGIALQPHRRLDLEALIQLSARLQQAVAEPVAVDGLRLHLTASVGFCMPRRESEKTGAGCLDAAQTALAEAQGNGPGSIRAFAPKARQARLNRTGLVAETAEALESGQIVPWFQPQISTDTGEISGMEALARWEHPDRGTILPGAFLPAIAAAGLTGRLSEVILYHSLRALQAWDMADVPVPMVGINLTGEDLSDPNLCERLRWELDRFDLSPGRLTVEILETVFAGSNDDMIARNITHLSELGCGIDLDDFGTGHASIASIRRFSVNRIKIDRSFVARVDTDFEQQQMLTAILDMAERLDIATLAEGVETVGEHARVAELGCSHAQGYAIARPMPFTDTVAWATAYRARLRESPRIARQTG